jgi:hypothetical protein
MACLLLCGILLLGSLDVTGANSNPVSSSLDYGNNEGIVIGGDFPQIARRTTEAFTVITRDSFGDAWNGGTLSITNSATSEVVATSTGPENGCNYSPPGNTCERTETVNLDCGSFSALISGGSYPDERSWLIKNSAGTTVAEAGGTDSATFIGPCASCGLGSGSILETECEPCPTGKYSDVDGPGVCNDCAGGTYR